LAAEHVERAERETDRRKALQEARRALSMDPGNVRAASVLARLVLEMPGDAVALVDAKMANAWQDDLSSIAGLAASVYVGLLLPCAVVALHIRNWAGFLAFMMPAAIAGTICTLLARRVIKGPAREGALIAVVGLSVLSVAGVSGIYGPLVLVPSLAVATACWVAVLPRRHRGLLTIGCCASVVAPMLLQLVGVLPPSYAYENGQMKILPVVTSFSETSLRLAALSVTVVAIFFAPTLVIQRLHRRLRRAREDLELRLLDLEALTAVEKEADVGRVERGTSDAAQ
jgi:serine/threonine-protein kinase